MLADNRLALSAEWDEDILRVELESLKEDAFDLDLVGFTDDEIEEILAPDDTNAGHERRIDRGRRGTGTAGDCHHGLRRRLGNGRAPAALRRRHAPRGRRQGSGRRLAADMAFTDPPYNINYEGRTEKKLKIKNDQLGSKFYDLLRDASANILSVCKGAVYICMSSSEMHTLRQAYLDAGGHWSGIIIWVKNHFTLRWRDYRHIYEPIMYGWREGSKHYWCGDKDQSDTWIVNRAASNREHPTMKPLELVERALSETTARPGTRPWTRSAGTGRR